MPVFALFPSPTQQQQRFKTYTAIDMSPANKASFSQALGGGQWQELYQCTEARAAFNLFLTQFQYLYDNAFPTVTKVVKLNRPPLPWLTTALKKSISH